MKNVDPFFTLLHLPPKFQSLIISLNSKHQKNLYSIGKFGPQLRLKHMAIR